MGVARPHTVAMGRWPAASSCRHCAQPVTACSTRSCPHTPRNPTPACAECGRPSTRTSSDPDTMLPQSDRAAWRRCVALQSTCRGVSCLRICRRASSYAPASRRSRTGSPLTSTMRANTSVFCEQPDSYFRSCALVGTPCTASTGAGRPAPDSGGSPPPSHHCTRHGIPVASSASTSSRVRRPSTSLRTSRVSHLRRRRVRSGRMRGVRTCRCRRGSVRPSACAAWSAFCGAGLVESGST